MECFYYNSKLRDLSNTRHFSSTATQPHFSLNFLILWIVTLPQNRRNVTHLPQLGIYLNLKAMYAASRRPCRAPCDKPARARRRSGPARR
ncbi:hypothetical protein P355_5299 [Burkholderia cenocepacia KC-01]|nr:hypothetical protein P355_5299 [Burkholderia cenocepacia KC-01]